jgi:hypothetical protein
VEVEHAYIEKIKGVLHKLNVKLVIEKADDLFKYMEYSDRKKKLIEIYAENIKNRGEVRAARSFVAKIS